MLERERERMDPVGDWKTQQTGRDVYLCPVHVHLERWKSVQDRFWWAQGQSMAGGPLRQVRPATKLCSKLREDRKRGCSGGCEGIQRLLSWEREREGLGAEGTWSFSGGKKLIFGVAWGSAPWG